MSVTDPTIIKITKLAKKIAYYDPEFVLKLAMYVRLDLNIRSTANYLLAVASNIKVCTPTFRPQQLHSWIKTLTSPLHPRDPYFVLSGIYRS